MAPCPNIHNPKVRDKFNSVVQMFNGTPLTIEEFKSVNLREQRSGNSKTAMDIAYYVWGKTLGEFDFESKADVEQFIKTDKKVKEKSFIKQDNIGLQLINKPINVGKDLAEFIINNNKDKSKKGYNVVLNKIKHLVPDNVTVEYYNTNEFNEKFPVTDNVQKGVRGGHFDPSTNTIRINTDIINIETLTHELLHSVTYNYLKNNKEFKDYYNKIKNKFSAKKLSFKQDYGLKNEQEFLVAIFTNKQFMSLLKNEQAIEPKAKRTIWQELWDLISQVLGFKDNMLYEAIENAQTVIDQVQSEYDLSTITEEQFNVEMSQYSEPLDRILPWTAKNALQNATDIYFKDVYGKNLSQTDIDLINNKLKRLSDSLGDDTWFLRLSKNGNYYIAGYKNSMVTAKQDGEYTYYSPYANSVFRGKMKAEPINQLTSKELSDDLFNGKRRSDTRTILDKIIKQENKNSLIATYLLELMNDNGIDDIDVRIAEDLGGFAGEYIRNENEEYIRIQANQHESSFEAQETVLHEIIHYLTTDFIESDDKLAKKWQEYYNEVSNRMTDAEKQQYGFEDYTEFLAEVITNSNFAIFLSEKDAINEGKYKYNNLWEEIWDTILNVLGINRKHSLYQEAFAFGTHILQKGSSIYSDKTIESEQISDKDTNVIYGKKINREYTNEETNILKKHDFYKEDKSGNITPYTAISNNKNAQAIDKRIDEANKQELKYKFERVQDNNLWRVEMRKNEKKIDDIIMIIKNDYIQREGIIIPNHDINRSEWNYMIVQMGSDVAYKAYKLNDGLLTKGEVDEYVNKLDKAKPSAQYDSKYEIDFDGKYETEYMEDYYDDYTMYEEVYESNSAAETMNTILTQAMDEIDYDTLNIDYSKLDKKQLKDIDAVMVDFKVKMNAWIKNLEKRIQQTGNKDTARKLKIELVEVKKQFENLQDKDKNLYTLLNRLERDLQQINNDIKSNNMNKDNVNFYQDNLDFWRAVIDDWRTDKGDTYSKFLNRSLDFQASVTKFYGIVTELQNDLMDYSRSISKNALNPILTRKLKDSNMTHLTEVTDAKREGFDASRTGNLVVDGLYKLLNNANNRMITSFNMFSNELDVLNNEIGNQLASSKAFQEMFLQKDENGDYTQTLVTEYNYEYYKGLDEINRLRMDLNRTKKPHTRNKLMKQITNLENEYKNYVDLSQVVNEDYTINADNLNKLEKSLSKKYNSHVVKKIMNNIKNKVSEFKKDYEAALDVYMYDIQTAPEYKSMREKKSNESNEDVQTRIKMEAETRRKYWLRWNSPFEYYKNLKKNVVDGDGHKYMVDIATDKYINKDFENNILNNSNEGVYKLYEFYTNKIKEYLAVLPDRNVKDLFDNFLPDLNADIWNRLMQAESKLNTAMDGIIEFGTVALSTTQKQLDITGKEVLDLPIRYITRSTMRVDNLIAVYEAEIDKYGEMSQKGMDAKAKLTKLKDQKRLKTKEFNKDIFQVLKSFVRMGETYNQLNAVESTILLTQRVINDIKRVKIQGSNRQFGTEGEYMNIEEGAKNVKEMVDYYIKAMMYDKKKAHTEIKGAKDKLLIGDSEQRKRYKELLKKQAELEEKKKNGEIGLAQHIIESKAIQSEMDSFSKLRAMTIDSIADTVISVGGMVNLGHNAKAAVHNLWFGKVSLLTHAAGGEDFSVQNIRQAFKILDKGMLLGAFQNNPLLNKIKSLKDLYNVAYQINEAAYGAKTTLDKKTEKLDIIKPYGMMAKGEFYIQSAVIIAKLLNENIKVKNKNGEQVEISLWDAYTNDGKFNTEYTYYNETTEQHDAQPYDMRTDITSFETNRYNTILENVQQTSKMIHGNYDPRSPILAKSKALGRLLLQYKTWLPEGIALRFEKELYDDMLGRHRKGRYTTAMEVGIGHTFKTLIKSFFNKDNISKDNYKKEIDYKNMLKNLAELRWVTVVTIANLSLYAIFRALDDDDENEKKAILSTINQLSRLESDIAFYLSPKYIAMTIESPIAAMGFVKKVLNWAYSARKLTGLTSTNEFTFGDWLVNGTKVLPVTNEIHKWYREATNLYLFD